MTAQQFLRARPTAETILRRGMEVIKVEAEALDLLARSLDASFVDACDAIINVAGRVVVTDYKSSDVRDLATANRRAKDSLQLSIYALAHEAERGSLPDELALHFLDSGIVGRAVPTEKRLEKAQEKIGEAATGIRGRRFEATPSAMRCGYCPFREICPDASR